MGLVILSRAYSIIGCFVDLPVINILVDIDDPAKGP